MIDSIIASAVLQSPTENYVSLPRPGNKRVQSLHLQDDDYSTAGCTTSSRLIPDWYTQVVEIVDTVFSCCRMSDALYEDEPGEVDFTIHRTNSIVDTTKRIYEDALLSPDEKRSLTNAHPVSGSALMTPPRRVSPQSKILLTRSSQNTAEDTEDQTGFLFVDRTADKATTKKFYPPPSLHYAHPLTSNNSCATATTASMCSDNYSVGSVNSLPTKVTIMTEDDRSHVSARPSEVTVPCSNIEWQHRKNAGLRASAQSPVPFVHEAHTAPFRRTFTDPDMAEQIHFRQLQSETGMMKLDRLRVNEASRC